MRRSLLPWGPGQQLAVGGSGLLLAGSGCITYSGAYETTGAAPGTVALYDGTVANGQLLAYYTLAEGQSTSENMGLHWLPFTDGIYVHTVTGSVAGTLTVWLDHSCERWFERKALALALAVGVDLAELGASGQG